jgi:DNA mismatch repair protein MutS
MPPELVERANEILKQLEEEKQGEVGKAESVEDGKTESQEVSRSVSQIENTVGPKVKNTHGRVKTLAAPQMQLSIFDAHSETFDSIRKVLESIDINRLTPVEALMKLNEIKGMVK